MIKILVNGYSFESTQRELNPINTNMTGLDKIYLCPWALNKSILSVMRVNPLLLAVINAARYFGEIF